MYANGTTRRENCGLETDIVSPGIDPGYSPVKIIILFSVYLVYCKPCGYWKFLAVHQVGFDDPSLVSC
jgi:hypothetical protein